MITNKVINEIYHRYRKRAASPDKLSTPLLFESASPDHNISIENEEVIIGSVDAMSPFHRIPLRVIHAIVEFDTQVIIVLHSSMLFLSKFDNHVAAHIKPNRPTLLQRLCNHLSRPKR
ncbi:MAG: hypothetical protein J6R27_02775 [Muribaculaceae bacterium]|nr:hypothetical protein [Muribaculaceae bacterium]